MTDMEKAIHILLIGAVILIGMLLAAMSLGVAFGGYQMKIVQSGSMEPAISTGSVVVIKAQEQYALGDIITFQNLSAQESFTTHRIVADGIANGQVAYTTRGDANDADDFDPVLHEQVVGAVAFTIPYLGYVLDFARQPLGFLVIVGVPAVLVGYDEIRALVTSVRKRKQSALPADETT